MAFMEVTDLFLRALDDRGEVYLPYALEGNWTDDEKAVVKAAIDPHVPERVDAMFNNWCFWKDEFGFSARRNTWDRLWSAKTAQDMADYITRYYSK